MNKWQKSIEGGMLPTFHLTKEANPYWFAKVYAKCLSGARYTFVIGKRIKEGEPTPPRYSWTKKGWKNASGAKAKALEWISRLAME